MMPAIRRTLIAIGFYFCAAPTFAQLPPNQGYTTPASVPPVSSSGTPTATVAPSRVNVDYIWFGNDQINQAVDLIRSNRFVEALEILDNVTKVNMRLPEAHLLRGVAYLQLKDLNRAEQAFNTVLAIDRGYLGAYVYLSDIAIQRGKLDQVQAYLQAIKAAAQTEDCAEFRFVKNSLRSVPAAAENQGAKTGQ